MPYLQCEVCAARGIEEGDEPDAAEFLTGEQIPKTLTCRRCVEWAVDHLQPLDFPFAVVRLSLAEQARRALRIPRGVSS